MPSSSLVRREAALIALLLLAFPTVSASASAVAEREPNDTCPGQSIICGDLVDPAAISPAGDVDWYSFNAISGEAITVETDGGSGCWGVNDTVIWLYASNCTSVLATDDDSGQGFYSKISSFIAPYTGAYAVKVTAYNDVESGCYDLLLACGQLASVDGNETALKAAITPNPTSGPCQISFRSDGAGPVAIRIVDVQGREVWRSDGWAGAKGYQSFAWDGRGADGRLVPTGIYVARVASGNRTTMERIVIAR